MASPSTSRDIDVESQIVSRVGGVPDKESVSPECGGTNTYTNSARGSLWHGNSRTTCGGP